MENPTSLETLLSRQPRQFSQLDLEGFTKKFKTKIGFGGYGNVYKGEFSDGVQIAVKVLSGVGEESFMAEVRTMSRAYHGNLVRLLGFCVDANMKALVYEYMENGSLDKILYESHLQIEWEKLYNIALEIANVLQYLHDGCGIIHHDVKAANVLLDSDLSPKLGDFGIARLLNKNVSHYTLTGYRGTPGYCAPEMIEQEQNSKVTNKCDVYSFGMMLFEILGRRKINKLQGQKWFPRYVWDKFESGQSNKLIIEDCRIRTKDRENAEILCKTALWCIQLTPKRRPSMRKAVNMLKKDVEVQSPPNPFSSQGTTSMSPPSQGMTSHSVTSMSPPPEVIPKVPNPFPSQVTSNGVPPGGENTVILYTDTLGTPKVVKDCNDIRSIVQSYKILMFERDIAKEPKYEKELEKVLGRQVLLPVLFVKGNYVGGANEVKNAENQGELIMLFDGIDEHSGFIKAGKAKLAMLNKKEEAGSCTLYDRWKTGMDIMYLDGLKRLGPGLKNWKK